MNGIAVGFIAITLLLLTVGASLSTRRRSPQGECSPDAASGTLPDR